MRFDIITIFPEVFQSYFNTSIIKRAELKKLIEIKIHNLRDFTTNKHKTVDDRPYGGGAGMVLMAEPIVKAVKHITRGRFLVKKQKIIILSAKGKQFNQKMASDWSKKFDRIILISGRYEGIDERVKTALKAEEISIGPYVLTDGDIPAMTVVSAVTRLLPGAIRLKSLQEESHWNLVLKKEATGKGLEYPHYTRPEILVSKGKKYRVPRVLLGGNHKKINQWRKNHTKK
jgi:tRNA (guanine37-N1)-methyltransferase